MKKSAILKEKKGLSPVIATTLLILIAIIIAIIILLWIKQFIGEKAEKNLGGGPVDLESVCKDVVFDADAKIAVNTEDPNKKDLVIHVGNKGNVPIYGIEIRKKSLTSVSSVGAVNTLHLNLAITSGEDEDMKLLKIDTGKINVGDNFIIVPIVLGENNKAKKAFVCGEEFGIAAVVAL
ncbi:hypothetical protein HYW75_03190 [Candidatus Pacearchaeota archaeon]|nr:hypothetical protein [Candidatus Pacearchaeota archaeon]